MAAEIFSDMVMEEAIKDKTIQVKQQLKDQESGQLIDPNNLGEHLDQREEIKRDEEDDEFCEEEEKIMRDIRDRRLAEMKNEYQTKQENLIKGHGQYTEIKEEEFLPNVTGSKFVVCHLYHKDFERCKIVDMHLRNIARSHTEAKFIYINAEMTPFFVKKL